MIAVVGVIAAGLHDDFLQGRGNFCGRRERFSLDPLVKCVLPVLPGENLLIRQVRKPAAVADPVHDQAERIDIRPGGGFYIGMLHLCFGNFRRGVVRREFHGERTAALQLSGNAEVAQLILAGSVDQNIIGFDVPVDDVQLPAFNQRVAYVYSQADDIRFLHAGIVNPVQQFHADQDIPQHFVIRMDDRIVFNRGDVGPAAERLHEADFRREVRRDVFEVGKGLFLGVTLPIELPDLGVSVRDDDHFDGRVKRSGKIMPDHMVDSAIGTGSDVFDIFQLRPSAVDQTKNFLFHPETSFLQGAGFAHFIIFTVFCKFRTVFDAGTADGTYAPGGFGTNGIR